MANSRKKPDKIPALIAYIIVTALLIAGLVLPLNTASLKNGFNFGDSPVMQLSGALAALGIPISSSSFSKLYSFPIDVFGANLDIGAALLIAYAAITVIAVILLVPACVAKRRGRAAVKIIFCAELIALSVLLVICAAELAANRAGWNLGFFIPFAAAIIAICVQTVIYHRGSGVIKIITFLLSACAVFLTVCNPGDTIAAFKTLFSNIADKMQSARPFKTSEGLYSIYDVTYYGSTVIRALLFDRGALAPGGSVGIAVTNYIAIAAAVIVCVNLFFDMLGLGKRTDKFMLLANLIRYILQFSLVIALAIGVFSVLGNFGILLYILAAITLIQLIIAIARFSRRKLIAKKVEEIDEDAEFADSDSEYDFENTESADNADEIKPVEQPAAAQTAAQTPQTQVETRNVVYNVNTIYNGPSDNFIKKLTNDEKVEFARIFLERRQGNISGIPEYVVGGDNSGFFSKIFIYFARVRDLVSDGLMNKFYEEVNLMS